MDSAHDTPLTSPVPISIADHALAELVGDSATRTKPWLSPATHSVGFAQETDSSADPVSTTFHADAPPVGLVELRTLPMASTATHSDDDGQSTALMRTRPRAFSTRVLVHAAAPPVGLVEVTTSPPSSTATHSGV